MCYLKRPTRWAEPKQYIEGEHELGLKPIFQLHL